MSNKNWSPILEGVRAAVALEVVECIARDLVNALVPPSNGEPALPCDPGIGSGQAGVSLFFEYLERSLPGHGYGEKADLFLNSAIDALNQDFSHPALFSGFTGVAWAVEHRWGSLTEAADDSGVFVAEAIEGFVMLRPWRRGFDLMNGLVGLGVYALERNPRSRGKECLEQVVAHLAETAEVQPEGGVAWKIPVEWLSPDHQSRISGGERNLGVAHGMPGVVAFLGRAAQAGIRIAEPLLKQAVAWLLTQGRKNGLGSVFPYRSSPTSNSEEIRQAWCYGDPGIACALFVAARGVGDRSLEQFALSVALQAAARPAQEAEIQDAGLCHGSAGLAHLYHRLYQVSGDPLLYQAAMSWFDWTLEFCRPGIGVGGFLTLVPGQSGPSWRSEPGFLTGAAGIGLALLAAATSVEPEWDRLLLIS